MTLLVISYSTDPGKKRLTRANSDWIGFRSRPSRNDGMLNESPCALCAAFINCKRTARSLAMRTDFVPSPLLRSSESFDIFFLAT